MRRVLLLLVGMIILMNVGYGNYYHPYLREHRSSVWNVNVNMDTPVGRISYRTNDQNNYNYRFNNRYIRVEGNSETTSVNGRTVVTVLNTPIRLEYHDRFNHETSKSRYVYYKYKTPEWVNKKESVGFKTNIRSSPRYANRNGYVERPSWANNRNVEGFRVNIQRNPQNVNRNVDVSRPSWINKVK